MYLLTTTIVLPVRNVAELCVVVYVKICRSLTHIFIGLCEKFLHVAPARHLPGTTCWGCKKTRGGNDRIKNRWLTNALLLISTQRRRNASAGFAAASFWRGRCCKDARRLPIRPALAVCLSPQCPVDPVLSAAAQKIWIERFFERGTTATAVQGYLLLHITELDMQQNCRRIHAWTNTQFANSLEAKHAFIKARMSRVYFDHCVRHTVHHVRIKIRKLKQRRHEFLRTESWIDGKL